MTKSRRQIGQWGEAEAGRYLAEQGCQVLEENWRCPSGEVDLVVLDGECLAFVEVRTRRGDAYGTPEQSITPRKLERMIAVAETYVYEKEWRGDWRLDVVAVRTKRGHATSVEWYRNVSM